MVNEAAELVELLVDGARAGDLDDVKAALDEGVDVNAADEYGRTALHGASANGELEIVKYLIDAGADLGLRNREGNTALHWACLCGQAEVVKVLMLNGASPTALNNQSRTPVDEVIGKPFQDSMLDIINSFFKSGLPAAQRAKAASAAADSMLVADEEGVEDGDEFEEDAQEGGGATGQAANGNFMAP